MTTEPKPRTQAIRLKPKDKRLAIAGWLSGRSTYLWIGENGDNGLERFVGTLGERQLYRLAKAIVRHYESDRP